jgi:hypothetical protein
MAYLTERGVYIYILDNCKVHAVTYVNMYVTYLTGRGGCESWKPVGVQTKQANTW